MSRTIYVPLKIFCGAEVSAGTPFLSFTEYLHFADVEIREFQTHAEHFLAAELRLQIHLGSVRRGGFIPVHNPFELAGLYIHQQAMHRDLGTDERTGPHDVGAADHVLPLAGE